MPDFIKQLLPWIQNNPYLSAILLVVSAWLGWEKKDTLLGWVKKFKGSKNDVDTETVAVANNDDIALLFNNPRYMAFYHLEEIREYAETQGSKEAVKNCVDLLNNLFKDYPKQPATVSVTSEKVQQ